MLLIYGRDSAAVQHEVQRHLHAIAFLASLDNDLSLIWASKSQFLRLQLN